MIENIGEKISSWDFLVSLLKNGNKTKQIKFAWI